MAKPAREAVLAALLERHGRTYCDELGIPIEKGTPSPLFRWLCASLLFSARISAELAARAAGALADAGWTTPEKMAGATWKQRMKVLNESGYARFDERTATMLGETGELLIDRYRGDLRRLREEAGREPEDERKLLKEFKGIGDVGVDIFFREVQSIWKEIAPFASRRPLEAAQRLGLGSGADELADLVSERELPRLVAALVRTELAGDHDDVLEAAKGA